MNNRRQWIKGIEDSLFEHEQALEQAVVGGRHTPLVVDAYRMTVDKVKQILNDTKGANHDGTQDKS